MHAGVGDSVVVRKPAHTLTALKAGGPADSELRRLAIAPTQEVSQGTPFVYHPPTCVHA